MAVFFLLLAVVVATFATNVGLYLRERRQLQNTADASALAGAAELPDLPDAALMMFRTYPRVAFYEQTHDNVPFFTDTGRGPF